VRPLVVAAGLAVGVGLLVTAPRPDTGIRRAAFVDAEGRPAGEVIVTEGDPDQMTCTISDSRYSGDYTIEVVLDDRSRREVGTFEVGEGGSTWTTPLRVDDDRIRAVEVKSPDGTTRSQARL
jgi:hypothetical protein